MCDKVSALQEQLAVILAGSTEENTGFYIREENSYHGGFGRGGSPEETVQASFIGADKTSAATIEISPNRGGAYGNDHGSTPLSFDQVRGVLVMMMATATSEKTRAIAGAFAKVVEQLSTQCFRVMSMNVTLSASDPEVRFELTNNYLDVACRMSDCSATPTGVVLQLDGQYLVGRRFLENLANPKDGHGGDVMLHIKDGDKYVPLASCSAYASERTENGKSIVSQEQLDGMIDTLIKPTRVEVVKKLIAEAGRIIAVSQGEVTLNEVRTNSYRGQGNTGLSVVFVTATHQISLELRNV